jgi:acetoacetyl-CoA synthetase
MLAAASIGAIWTGVSPDTGVTAVLERLVQIEPKILFVDNAVLYNGKVHGSFEKVREIVKGLKGLVAVVTFETIKGYEMNDSQLQFKGGEAWTYEAFLTKWYGILASLKLSKFSTV